MKRRGTSSKSAVRRRGNASAPHDEPTNRGNPRPIRFGLIVVGVLAIGASAGIYLATRSWQRRVTEQTGDPKIIKTVQVGHEPWLADPAFSPEATVEQLIAQGTENTTELLRAFPDSAVAAGIAGRWWFNLGQTAKARTMWQRSIQLDPRFTDGYFGMGVIAKDGGDFDEAVKMFTKVVELDPAEPQAPSLLGETLMKSGHIEQAVGFLERAARQPDPSVITSSDLGQAYLQMKQYDKARRIYEALIQAAPNTGSAYYGLAQAYAKLGQRKKAREYLKKYRSFAAVDQEELVRYVRGYSDRDSLRKYLAQSSLGCAALYTENGEKEAAERYWRMTSVLDPTNTLCLEQLLTHYESQHRLADAVLIGRQLCNLQPDNPDHWLDVAILYGRLGRLDQAMTAAAKAVQLAPGNPKYKQAYEVIRQNR